ncbi:HIRAN domain-containing protein [Terrabacter sp. 2YAF2]
MPASPTGAAVEAWAISTKPCEVAGEWFYQDAFRAVYKRRGAAITAYGQELQDLAAELAIDPSNPHDPNAVAVWVSGQMLGFLPRGTAAEYAPALADLAEEGGHLSVSARAWARADDNDQIYASATVWLPPAHGVQPFNAFPEGPYQVLPAGRAVQVTGEDEHMDVLRPFVSDRERYLVVTLHLVQEARTPRSTPFEAIEVRLGGRRVGTLTKAMSGQLRDLVAHVDGLSRLPACCAVLRGSPLRAELTLHVARSADVTSRWLDSIATA